MALGQQELKMEVPCNVRLCNYGKFKKRAWETSIICEGCSLNAKSSFDCLMLRLSTYLHKHGKYNLQSLLTLLTIITTSPRQAQEEANECTDRWGWQRRMCSCRFARIRWASGSLTQNLALFT